jgi:hypothetical protein
MQMHEASGVNVPHHTMTLAVAATDVTTFSEMEKVFARSEDTHQSSIEAISKSLTLPKAMEVVQRSTLSNADANLAKVTSLLTGSQNLRSKKNDGFGGLDGARRLLNDMIHEAMTKYDAEIARCTAYYAKQCALMEVARGQISAANFIAANSRALILDAQGNINMCERDIPETKQELKDHSAQCKGELHKMNERLKVLMGDIAVMTMILEMSDCDAKLLVQTEKLAMLRCKDQCTKEDSVTFNHDQLQSKVNQLQSPESKQLISDAFADMFDDGDSADGAEFVQVNGSAYLHLQQPGELPPMDGDGELPPMEGMGELTPPKKKAKFNNPPVPRTKVPSNPCTDPNKGAPSAEDKRAAKCTLKKSPRCYKLQGRFLQIQAEIADARDQLMEEIQEKEDKCAETKKTLEDSIEADGSLLSSSQTKLAAATEKEASAGETGRQVAKENQQYNDDLLKTMKTCSTNYIDFETELCALRKIRGDLFKKMKPGHPGFFQDCEVTKWSPEACTKKCAGGDQKLTRSVMTHPSGGSKCLPLSAEKRCNLSPCPVNCRLASWSGWSKCSSKCGGGLATRVRDVNVPMQYAGKPCGETTEAKQCNVEACEKDCVLHEWTKWTACSKHCDGGSRKRQRFIKEPAEGSGACAGQWDPSRLQYKKCSMHRCKVPDPTKVMKCNQTLDIMLLLDGTPKSGKKGWAMEVKAANLLVDAFSGDGVTAKPNFAVIHYTGPRTWSGVSKCTGKSTKKVDMEKDCRITIASHFEEDTKKVKSIINGLQFAPGSKLLSLGLMTAQAEMALGRKTARSVVIVFMDGQPLSYRKTKLASWTLRKKARLVYVVVAKFSPLADIKKWTSRRWQENLVKVGETADFEQAEIGTHVIADICPKEFPKLKTKKKTR